MVNGLNGHNVISKKLRIIIAVLIPLPGLALAPALYFSNSKSSETALIDVSPAATQTSSTESTAQWIPSSCNIEDVFDWAFASLPEIDPLQGFSIDLPKIQLGYVPSAHDEQPGASSGDGAIRLVAVSPSWRRALGSSGISHFGGGGGRSVQGSQSGDDAIPPSDEPSEDQGGADAGAGKGATDSSDGDSDANADDSSDTDDSNTNEETQPKSAPPSDDPPADGSDYWPPPARTEPVQVPEPGTLGLFGLGLMISSLGLRRRKR